MSHTNPLQEIIDTTQENDREDHSSGSEAEHPGHSPDASQASSSKRKKKKKSKAARILDSLNEIPHSLVNHVVSERKAEQDGGVASPDAEAVRQALNNLKLMDALKAKTSVTEHGKNTLGEHKVWTHTPSLFCVITLPQFWATQPVPQLGKPNRLSSRVCLNDNHHPGDQPPTEDGFIEPTKAIQEVRQEPYPLPKDFEWSTLDLNDPKQVCAVCPTKCLC